MRTLPALVVGNQTWTLPFSDRSAVALVEELLGASSLVGARRSADRLALDPPLILWTACCAWQAEGLRPRSLDRLLRWLLDHAAHVLQWSTGSGTDYDGSPSDDEKQRFARQVTSDLIVAELAFAQAAE